MAETPTRILLVDDDGMVARGYGRLLQRKGHQVTLAATAEEAGGMLMARPFDVIVSDIMMPGGGGLAMLRAAHAVEPDLPVILITGCPTVESAVEAVQSGALKYLMKPMPEGGLEQAVADAAAHYRLARMRRDALAEWIEGADGKAALGKSFDRGLEQLWMAYQPIISWSRQDMFGFEALLRTTEPAFPNPGVFLAAAEKLGRLHDLGRTIRNSVAAMLTEHPSPAAAFVNLHAQDLFDDQLYDPESPLTAFAPRVMLEITERASIDNIRDLDARVQRLRALGFKIAIDDLGAGYAGLTTIAQLEPDVVKLDMSLVRGVATERTKRKLISSIANVSRDLGILVVAEGIETPAERDALLELGCDLLQGYLFGKPQKGCPALAGAATLIEVALPFH